MQLKFMETLTLDQKTKLIEGCFDPSEIGGSLLQIIDEQINRYKLKNLSNWIKDHGCDQDSYYQKIAELEAKKSEIKSLLKEAKMSSCHLHVRHHMEISLSHDN